MKHLRLLVLAFGFVLLGNTSKAQWVSIPDTIFGYQLNMRYPQCMMGNSTTGWQMDTTCWEITNELTYYTNGFTMQDLTGIQYFDNLEILDFTSASLSQLPPLPPNLTSLNCSNQQANLPPGQQFTLTSVPQGLTEFNCAANGLTALPPLPSGLLRLHCEWNAISALPPLPTGLKRLYCEENNLTSISTLPGGLTALSCSANPINTLPALPASLDYLVCMQNNLTTLPALPTVLRVLQCDRNSLSTLPPLPTGLEILYCSYNLLTSLPALGPYLYSFICDSNMLTTLPSIPKSAVINTLSCKKNQISNLDSLPSAIGACYLDNNPLACLPPLGNITNLTFTNTNITCLPNYPTGNLISNPLIDTIPLCDFFNSGNCSVYWNINGKAYEDANSNCVYNIGENVISNYKAQLWQNGNLLKQTTPVAGLYYFDTDSNATYQVTIDTANLPFNIKCPANGSLTSITTALDSMDYNMDFALECKPGFDLEAKSVFGDLFRPANFTTVEITAGDATNFYNGHCAAGTAGSVTLSFTGPVSYIAPDSAALTPVLNGNTLTWNVADFGSVNFFEDFDVVVQTDTTAQANQQVCFTLTVNPIVNDNNPANNTITHCFPIVNSYDPNDKQAYPAGNIDTLQEELTYTVRFQNTGNAEAQHIYITDTLDSNVKPASFQLLAYSHQPMVQIDGNAVRFNFPNINLPDSTSDEPASHGYVQYKVKLKENLPVGTVINNTAFIYFDFNAPVVTNTTTNTIAVEVDTTVGIKTVKTDAQVTIYPNPANNAITITASKNMQGATVTITNILGRRAMEPVTLNNASSTINVQHLPEGIYMVNVRGNNGTSVTKRLVVSR